MMYIKITVEVAEPEMEMSRAVLLLNGDEIQSVRVGQWIEQMKSQLCKKVRQQKKECCAS